MDADDLAHPQPPGAAGRSARRRSDAVRGRLSRRVLSRPQRCGDGMRRYQRLAERPASRRTRSATRCSSNRRSPIPAPWSAAPRSMPSAATARSTGRRTTTCGCACLLAGHRAAKVPRGAAALARFAAAPEPCRSALPSPPLPGHQARALPDRRCRPGRRCRSAAPGRPAGAGPARWPAAATPIRRFVDVAPRRWGTADRWGAGLRAADPARPPRTSCSPPPERPVRARSDRALAARHPACSRGATTPVA